MELFIMWFIYSFLPLACCILLLVYYLYQRSILQAEPDFASMPKRRRSAAKKAHQFSKKDTGNILKIFVICLCLTAFISLPYGLDAVMDTEISVITSKINCRQTSTGSGSARRVDSKGIPYYTYSIDANGSQHRLHSSFDYSQEMGYDFDSGIEYEVTYYKFTKTIKSISPVNSAIASE